MATVYIREYARIGRDLNSIDVQSGVEPGLVNQTVAIGGSSVQSAAFNAQTRFVRIHTDAICSILFGTNPTAVAGSGRMAANSTEFFAVDPGSNLKVAVITNV